MKDYSFGNYICALRIGLGLSQFQLGTLVGVTDKAVSKWENSDAKPKLSTCYRLAAVLGVSISELLSCGMKEELSARKELEKMKRKLWEQAREQLKERYGETPPIQCWNRLLAEEHALRDTNAIQSFAVLRDIDKYAKEKQSAILVSDSLAASFTAWLLGATKVNPLPPHYRCPKCKKVDFSVNAAYGYDLPPKVCDCGERMERDGFNIPFEIYADCEQVSTNVRLKVSKDFLPDAVKKLEQFYAGIAELVPLRLDYDDGTYAEKYVVVPEEKGKPSIDEDGFWHPAIGEYLDWYQYETTFTFLHAPELDALDAVAKEKNGLPDPHDLLKQENLSAICAAKSKEIPEIQPYMQETVTVDWLLKLYAFTREKELWEAAGDLLRNQTTDLCKIPTTREDVWTVLMGQMMLRGVREDGIARMITTSAARGRYYCREIPKTDLGIMQELCVPAWYPDFFRKVRFLQTRGVYAAHLINDLLLMWYQKRESV